MTTKTKIAPQRRSGWSRAAYQCFFSATPLCRRDAPGRAISVHNGGRRTLLNDAALIDPQSLLNIAGRSLEVVKQTSDLILSAIETPVVAQERTGEKPDDQPTTTQDATDAVIAEVA